VSGRVVDTNGAPVAGAIVNACDTCAGIDACVHGSTDSTGHYDLRGFVPDDVNDCLRWEVSVSPPAGSSLLSNSRRVFFTTTDKVIADADVVLDFPEFIPSGGSIVPSTGGGFGGVPRVFWQSPLTLTTTGCRSVVGHTPPVARYMIAQDDDRNIQRCDVGPSPSDPTLLRCGTMAEVPENPGTYVTSIAPLVPAHGAVKVTMTLTCPKDPIDPNPAPSGSSTFDLYIDPSGWVLTLHDVPLPGARVTLFRSESALGPFAQVPDGSALMSPENRRNPDHTDTAGHFHWDTVAGFYVVRAEFPGCVSPHNPSQSYVETDILPVPPEWTDLRLFLDCGQIAPPRLSLPPQVLAEATSTAGAVVSYTVSANDDRDGPVPVTCSQPSGRMFAVGTTVIECSASNVVGNVARGSFPVIVSYSWSNVLPPLRPAAGNRLKRGRTVPVKFALTGPSSGIRNLVARLYVAAVVGGVPGPELPATSATRDCHDARFRYDRHDAQYVFNWSTRHLDRGQYQLRIDLGDGVSRTVPVELR
jgi:hypothetical protein